MVAVPKSCSRDPDGRRLCDFDCGRTVCCNMSEAIWAAVMVWKMASRRSPMARLAVPSMPAGVYVRSARRPAYDHVRFLLPAFAIDHLAVGRTDRERHGRCLLDRSCRNLDGGPSPAWRRRAAWGRVLGQLGRRLIGPVSGIASRRGWQLPARDGGDRRLSVVCSLLSGVGPSQEAGRGEVRAVQGRARGDGWRLKSANGQTIATGGDRYKSKAGAQNSIDDVRAGRPRRLGRRPDLIATGPGMARRPARDGHDLRRPPRTV
jgi:Domain of unknown function (DUF1508)